jgi:hypothetical protein
VSERDTPGGPERRGPFGEPAVDPNKDKLDQLTAADLRTPIRRMLQTETAAAQSWTYELLKGRGGDGQEGLGVYRFSGTAQTSRGERRWSMVLKIVLPLKDETRSHAGKREALAYQSGFLRNLPGGLAAPRCYEVVEQAGGEIWMWIEEIVDAIGDQWPLERWGLAARHLGQLNGAYLVDEPLPDYTWLSRRWLRQYTLKNSHAVAHLDENLSHPLMRRICPPEIAQELEGLWSRRLPWLDAIERLPQVFCHMDAFRRNLFARYTAAGTDETVAVDWPYCGIGGVGEELAPLVSMGQLGRRDVSPEDWRALGEVVFSGYMDGLCDAGWRGDPNLARFGLVASAPLRYGFMSTRFVEFFNTLDRDQQAKMAQRIEAELDKNVSLFNQFQRFLFELAREAQTLFDSLTSRGAFGDG